MASLDKVFKEVSVKKLFKDLMLLARFMGQRQGNEEALVGQVRQQFRMNMHETDEAKGDAGAEQCVLPGGRTAGTEETLSRGAGRATSLLTQPSCSGECSSSHAQRRAVAAAAVCGRATSAAAARPAAVKHSPPAPQLCPQAHSMVMPAGARHTPQGSPPHSMRNVGTPAGQQACRRWLRHLPSHTPPLPSWRIAGCHQQSGTWDATPAAVVTAAAAAAVGGLTHRQPPAAGKGSCRH